jgi:hypothetical protein
MRWVLYIATWLAAAYALVAWSDHHTSLYLLGATAPGYRPNPLAILGHAAWFALARAPLAAVALPAGFLFALARRVQWRSYTWASWLFWMPFSLLAALFLLVAQPMPMIGGVYLNGLLLFMVGSTLGGLCAFPFVLLLRVKSHDVGFCSWPLSFLWRSGSDEVVVRYRTGRLRRKTARVPLGEFHLGFEQETVFRSGYIPSVSTGTGYTSSGETIHVTTTGPGQHYAYNQRTGRSQIRVGGIVDSNVYLRRGARLEAEANARRLKPRSDAIRAKQQEAAKAQKQQHNDIALERAQAALRKLAEQAGLNDEHWYDNRYSTHAENPGVLLEAIAADREGRGYAVYNKGQSTWIGSWKQAVVHETRQGLDIQVNDSAYRQQHMTERRFQLGAHFTVQSCQEWVSRIRLLSR